MIHHTVQQGSAEWHRLRATIPTASNFDRLITPAKWERTKGETWRNFQLELLANRIFGLSAEAQFSSSAMEHGREWEPIARAAYEFERGVEIADGGFWTDDAMTYGASPDGLIGDDGLIEFKNPENPKVHLSALLDSLEYADMGEGWTATVARGAEVTGFLRDHWAQVQGQLLVTGRSWCDLVCNFSRLPMVVVRVHPNHIYQELLRDCLSDFCFAVEGLTEKAQALGWYKKPGRVVAPNALDMTDDDVELVIGHLRKTNSIQTSRTQ